MRNMTLGLNMENCVRILAGNNPQSGKSTVAKSAYRNGEEAYCYRTDKSYNFSHRDDVEAKDVYLPEQYLGQDIYGWAYDRHILWNSVELIERNGSTGPRKNQFKTNVTVAREFVISLPHEWTKKQRAYFVDKIAQDFANKHHVIVDCAIHRPSKSTHEHNYHIHMVHTQRVLNGRGGFGKRKREFSQREKGRVFFHAYRKHIAQEINAMSRHHGHKVKVHHQSFKDRGISRPPQQKKGRKFIYIGRKIATQKLNKHKENHMKHIDQWYLKRKTSLQRRQTTKKYAAHIHGRGDYLNAKENLKQAVEKDLAKIRQRSTVGQKLHKLLGHHNKVHIDKQKQEKNRLYRYYGDVKKLIAERKQKQDKLHITLKKQRDDLERLYQQKMAYFEEKHKNIDRQSVENERQTRKSSKEYYNTNKRFQFSSEKLNIIKKQWSQEVQRKNYWKRSFAEADRLNAYKQTYKGHFNNASHDKRLTTYIQDRFDKLKLDYKPRGMRSYRVLDVDNQKDYILHQGQGKSRQVTYSFKGNMPYGQYIQTPVQKNSQNDLKQNIAQTRSAAHQKKADADRAEVRKIVADTCKMLEGKNTPLKVAEQRRSVEQNKNNQFHHSLSIYDKAIQTVLYNSGEKKDMPHSKTYQNHITRTQQKEKQHAQTR